MPFSKLIHAMGQIQAAEQYVELDKGLILEDVDAATAIGSIGPGVVTTGSAFEDMWRYQFSFQYPGQQRLIYNAKKSGEEDKVTTEHK